MPLDGKSGWIDESLTTWIENGYKASTIINVRADGNIIGPYLNEIPLYTRHTNLVAYDGEEFFAYLNHKFLIQGGLKPFLPYFFNKYKFKAVTTEVLKEELEFFYSTDLKKDFDKYIFIARP